MIIFFILFLLLTLLLALKKPGYFPVFYILASTKFLGFFDIESMFVFGGVGLGMASLNAVTFVAAFSSRVRIKIPQNHFRFVLVFFLFFAYGVLLPTLLEFESVAQAIIASKEFWSISLLVYLVSYRNRIKIYFVVDAIKFVGIYLALSYLTYSLFSYSPPFYINGHVFRGFFPTYISMALFFYYYEWQCRVSSVSKFCGQALLLIVGLVLAGHFALVVGTIVSLLLLDIFYRKNNLSASKLITRSMIFLCIMASAFLSSPSLWNFTVTQIEQVVSGEDKALSSRNIYNQFRWNAIEERPLGGYGFVHKSSPITKKYIQIKNNRFTESFGVIDSGYVDILIRFGYLGLLVYLFLWANIVFKVLVKLKNNEFVKLLMAFYLLQYFAINFTWSVFTFSHGLIPAFIAVFVINMQNAQAEIGLMFHRKILW